MEHGNHLDMLKNLLPQGIFWERVDLSPLHRPLAKEFDRLVAKAKELDQERDPRTATFSLKEWAKAYGLEATENRDLILIQIKLTGGSSKDYMLSKLRSAFPRSQIRIVDGFSVDNPPEIPEGMNISDEEYWACFVVHGKNISNRYQFEELVHSMRHAHSFPIFRYEDS